MAPRTAQLDTPKSLCYVQHVLGDSVPRSSPHSMAGTRFATGCRWGRNINQVTRGPGWSYACTPSSGARSSAPGIPECKAHAGAGCRLHPPPSSTNPLTGTFRGAPCSSLHDRTRREPAGNRGTRISIREPNRQLRSPIAPPAVPFGEPGSAKGTAFAGVGRMHEPDPGSPRWLAGAAFAVTNPGWPPEIPPPRHG